MECIQINHFVERRSKKTRRVEPVEIWTCGQYKEWPLSLNSYDIGSNLIYTKLYGASEEKRAEFQHRRIRNIEEQRDPNDQTRCSAVCFSLIHSTLSLSVSINRQRQNCVLFMSINMQFGVFVFVFISHSNSSMCSARGGALDAQPKTTITTFNKPKSMKKMMENELTSYLFIYLFIVYYNM